MRDLFLVKDKDRTTTTARTDSILNLDELEQ